ncbi:MAG: UbiA-like polyprenyltransferase [Saprospiraceae bacterium]
MIVKYLNLVKFSHTIFALPFAVVGFSLGLLENGVLFDLPLFGKVILSMVFARSAAMAFNRYLDRDIDKLNPRTASREIPSGILKANKVLYFTLINTFLFIAVTYFINPICFYLSPIALLIILGYSYTKRYTAYCHLILGIGLALAPIGAFLSVTGYFHYLPVLLGFSVFFWVSGFDIIYALQDREFDISQQLKSLPVVLGKEGALLASRLLHGGSILCIVLFSYQASQTYEEMSTVLYIGTALFLVMLIYQHFLVKADDLSRVGLAFFTFNGMASLTFGSMFILDTFFL